GQRLAHARVAGLADIRAHRRAREEVACCIELRDDPRFVAVLQRGTEDRLVGHALEELRRRVERRAARHREPRRRTLGHHRSSRGDDWSERLAGAAVGTLPTERSSGKGWSLDAPPGRREHALLMTPHAASCTTASSPAFAG